MRLNEEKKSKRFIALFYRLNLLEFQQIHIDNTVHVQVEFQMSLFHRTGLTCPCAAYARIKQWKRFKIYEIKWTTPTTHTHNYGLL